MSILTFINSKGDSIDLTNDYPYKLTLFEGTGGTSVNNQTQSSPYQDGAEYIDSLLEPRDLHVEFVIARSGQGEIEKMRQTVNKLFNPKLGIGTLRYNYSGIKEIKVIIDAGPSFPVGNDNKAEGMQRVLVDFIAPDPYWRSPNDTSKPLQAYVGNFTLPFTLPFELGTSGSRTTLYNEGDVPAPIRIDIQGPVTNPQIINNTTGAWLRVNRSITADEILHIDTTEGRKRVEIYRGNNVYQAFGYLDHDSAWLTLEIGENIIEHIADAGDRNSLVAVTWNSQFVGI